MGNMIEGRGMSRGERDGDRGDRAKGQRVRGPIEEQACCSNGSYHKGEMWWAGLGAER